MKRAFLSLLFTLCLAIPAWSTDFYVSPNGDDSADGLTPKTAWRTIKAVNQSKSIQPGDRVLFECGGIWRTGRGPSLHPHSGEEGKPVTYSSYGKGEKPTIYGSVSASNEKDWVQTAPNIWGTRETKRENLGKIEIPLTNWWLHTEHGAKCKLTPTRGEDGVTLLTLKTAETGTAPNHIQLWGSGPTNENMKEHFVMKFRARATVPFTMPAFTIMQAGFPYYTKCSGGVGSYQITTEWQDFEAQFTLLETDCGTELRWHLNLGQMPANCELEILPGEIFEVKVDDALDLAVDVGNIIFDHGNFTKYHRCGIKKWSLDDLKAPGDYFYDAASYRVFLYWPENPAKTCKSIELAMRRHVVDHSCIHDVIIDGLGIAYGAAHGFGGTKPLRYVIRNCDVYYIGGAHQFTTENGRPVRFGNGIEYWGSATDCLVEKCRLWEIYDAALTNQGRGNENDPSNEVRITYRENEIWNSEYSFEYWNSGGVTSDILFEKNVCRDAGFGWAHGQRPDPNGAHMMFYNNRAETTNFVVRGNVFTNSTEVCIRLFNDWSASYRMEGNKYSMPEGKPVVRFLQEFYTMDQMNEAREKYGIQ